MGGNKKKGNDEKKTEDSKYAGSMGENGTGESQTKVSHKDKKDLALEAIEQSLNNLHEKLDRLQTAQNDSDNSITRLKNRAGVLESNHTTLQEENTSLRQEVDMLKELLVRQHKDMEILKSTVLDLQVRSMQDNLLFHNVPEEKDENCADKLKKILNNKGYTKNCVFERIHRIGPYNARNQKPRPVVAKMQSHKHVSDLLDFSRSLPKGTANDFRISSQYPAEVRERRRVLGEIAESERSKRPNVRTKIVTDTLYVDGKKYLPKLTRPAPRDLLYMSEDDKELAGSVNFTKTAVVKEADSSFVAFAAPAKSIGDVRDMYRAVLSRQGIASASHCISGYRLYNPVGAKTTDGFHDDGDHGLGRVVRDTLHRLNARDVVVFVVRNFGGTHIGQKRFKIVEDLVKNVMSSYNEGQ